MRLGILSDTHGFLDPRIPGLFEGVDRILHAGDIGFPSLILELEAVAPVTAVQGNVDLGLDFPLTEVVELADRRFLIHHIVDPAEPERSIGPRFVKSRPSVVIFGHSHKAFHEERNGVTFLNPGYCGKSRFSQPRSVAIASVVPGAALRVVFIPLD